MQRSSAITLFGEATLPSASGGYPCDLTAGLTFSWTGDNSLGQKIPLTFDNQARE